MTEFRKWLPGWIALGCLFWRLLGLFALSDSPLLTPGSGDMRFYFDWAMRILGGEWTDGAAFYALPGYPWLMAGLFALGGANPFLPGLVQVLCDAGLAAVLVGFARGLCRSQPGWFADVAGATAGLLWIFFAPASAFSIIMMPTLIVVAAYWRLILWAATDRPPPPWWIWLGFGVGVGLLALLVATLFAVLPILVVAAGVRYWEGLAGPAWRLGCFWWGCWWGVPPRGCTTIWWRRTGSF